MTERMVFYPLGNPIMIQFTHDKLHGNKVLTSIVSGGRVTFLEDVVK